MEDSVLWFNVWVECCTVKLVEKELIVLINIAYNFFFKKSPEWRCHINVEEWKYATFPSEM